MTLKELTAVSLEPVYIASATDPAALVRLTNYHKGSAGIMSLQIEKLSTYQKDGLCEGLLALIDLVPPIIKAIGADAP